jgi:tetrapyrrole methylase family protein/MazG family protein
MSKAESLLQLIETVHRLRAPDGCPWDKAQTHQTLRPYVIEEAYEVLDVLDRIKTVDDLKVEKNEKDFKEELGDLLMQVVLHSEMTKEEGFFDIYDVAAGLNDKLIRRHPHVFGEVDAKNADQALKTWEQQKQKEKAENPEKSVLDGIPRALPSLQRTLRIIEKATRVGFQWSDLKGPLEKLDEEFHELQAEITPVANHKPTDEEKRKIEGELGDVFFSLCNVAHFLKINPEDALRSTLERFESRFKHVEKRLKEKGKSPEQSSLEEMDLYWNEAKRKERSQKK